MRAATCPGLGSLGESSSSFNTVGCGHLEDFTGSWLMLYTVVRGALGELSAWLSVAAMSPGAHDGRPDPERFSTVDGFS